MSLCRPQLAPETALAQPELLSLPSALLAPSAAPLFPPLLEGVVPSSTLALSEPAPSLTRLVLSLDPLAARPLRGAVTNALT